MLPASPPCHSPDANNLANSVGQFGQSCDIFQLQTNIIVIQCGCNISKQEPPDKSPGDICSLHCVQCTVFSARSKRSRNKIDLKNFNSGNTVNTYLYTDCIQVWARHDIEFCEESVDGISTADLTLSPDTIAHD